MRRVLCLSATLIAIALSPAPASAMAPHPAAAAIAAGPAVATAGDAAAAATLVRCGPRCRAERRAVRRYHRHHWGPGYRPYRPRPSYPYHRHRRGDAAAAAIIGGVIGLGVGAAIMNHDRAFYGYDTAPDFGGGGSER